MLISGFVHLQTLGIWIWSWCVMKTEWTCSLQQPKRLSEITTSMPKLFTIDSMVLWSLLKHLNATGNDAAILKTCVLLLLYVGMNPGNLMNSMSGNALCRNARGPWSAAIITLWPWLLKALMIGTQRVAWPNPQSNGHIRIFFPKKIFFANIIKISIVCSFVIVKKF